MIEDEAASGPVPGRKDDNGKARYDLIAPEVEEYLAKALAFGAAKYGDENWRKVPNLKSRYYAAARRHLNAWRLGEVLDRQSGLPHLSHALCCITFLLANDVTKETK